MAALDNIASELLKSANEADLIYKRTRDQAQRDKAVRLRRIVENLKAISAGGLTPTLDEVLTEGNVSTNTLNVGGITSDYFQLDTAATPTPVQGMMFWDSDRSTVDVQLDADVSAKIGQDNFWYVKNQSGATIPKGKAVMAVGTLGASGRILIDEMVANGSISSKFLLGITAEDIANGADGFVMNIGKLRQVNTTIWPDGTVLYCDPTTAGNLTSTKPSSPNLALPVAFVVHSAVNGVLAIRVSILDENAFNTPTLAQVTTAGNTTTNSIIVGATQYKYLGAVVGEIRGNANTYNNFDLVYGASWNGSQWIDELGAYGSNKLTLGNDGIVFYTGSNQASGFPVNYTERMRMAGTGNVLIGTTTDAGYRLDVNGQFRATGESILASASGNVGIGTVSPTSKLHINGADPFLRVNNVGSANTHGIKISYNSSDTQGFHLLYNPPAAAAYLDNTYLVTSGQPYGDIYFRQNVSGTMTTRMTIKADGGNVGIGTSNPLYKLHVTDSAGDIVYILASTGQSAIIGATGSGTNRMYIGYSPGAENISITSSGVVRLNSITSGNVLIGTTTDSGYKLDVNGTVRINSYLTVLDSPYVNTGRIYFGSGSAYGPSGTNPLYMRHDSGNWYFTGLNGEELTISLNPGSISTFTLAQGDVYFNANQAGKNLYLQTQAATKMAILSSGNVGIGTINPTDKFHIVDNTNGNKFGRISAGGTDASAAWVAQNDQVDNVVYRVFGSAVTGSQMGQALARSASLIANLGGTGKFLIGSFSGTDLIFGTSDQARMRLVDATGNFLIGTMTDTGNKLTVSGNIDAQGYKVNNVLGYTGILNIPTNPPGQQNIDIQGGIVINIF